MEGKWMTEGAYRETERLCDSLSYLVLQTHVFVWLSSPRPSEAPSCGVACLVNCLNKKQTNHP